MRVSPGRRRAYSCSSRRNDSSLHMTLMASVPWNLFLYGIEVESDTHLFWSDVGNMSASATSCWIAVKLSGLTFAYFTKSHLYIYILNSKQHCRWFSKSQCLSCSNEFFTVTSIVYHHCCPWIRFGISSNGDPCIDGVPGSQQHLEVLLCSYLQGLRVAVFEVLVSLLLV